MALRETARDVVPCRSTEMSVRPDAHPVVSPAGHARKPMKSKPMKTDNSNENAASLRSLLKEWKPEVLLPRRFQEQVWRRIERVETAPAASVSVATVLGNWIANLLPKPALAT